MRERVCNIFALLLFPTAWASYEEALQLESFLFTNYSPRIRPVLNYSQPIEVTCSFQIVTIVGVNEMQGELSLIGGFDITWKDEKLQWNPSDYGGVTYLHPYPKDIWRPRLQFINSLDDADLFEDNYDSVTLLHTGDVYWRPGGLFPSLCNLNLKQFPFDSHTCSMSFRPIFAYNFNILIYLGTSEVRDEDVYAENGEWMLKHAEARINSVFQVILVIERRPEYFIMNFLIPVMLLSVLNLLSFTMVVGDGSVNIGHSMTVLLAYTIYMSILIDHLPSVSLNMPYLTFYLFILFVMSLLITVDIIFIVWLHNKEEEKEKKQKRQSAIKGAMNKLISLRKVGAKPISPSEEEIPFPQTQSGLVQSAANEATIEDEKGPALPVKIRPQGENELTSRAPFQLNSGKSSEEKNCDGVQHDSVVQRSRCVNRYKHLSEKVRVYSLCLFIAIDVFVTVVACIITFG